MLNISENSIKQWVDPKRFESFAQLPKSEWRRMRVILISALLLALIGALFLPWTQNISSKGKVTTRSPQQRPQAIQTVIAGQISKWYVQEGDFVAAGDTIVHLSEVKSEYFDPDLVQRTQEQLDAKALSVESYDAKILALENQYRALQSARDYKESQFGNKRIQARNKVKIDSIELLALEQNLVIAQNQVDRTQDLYDQGLKSLSQLQEKEVKLQQTNAKVTAQRNKLDNARNILSNLDLEWLALEREYADKLSKSASDKQSARSAKMEAIAANAKLGNTLSNYQQRQQYYYIVAPQSGYITKTIKKGIGEIMKEGADVATIVPAQYDLAVELYVKPQDMPLLHVDNEVTLRFDGWPALVISGWPERSTGFFKGRVVAIDQYISDNGLYRLMVSPDPADRAWPENVRIGTGSQAFILLGDVPIWYEVWRQLNGFPQDFYQPDEDANDVKRKAPIKSIK